MPVDDSQQLTLDDSQASPSQEKAIDIAMPAASEHDALSSFCNEEDLIKFPSNNRVERPVVPIPPPHADPEFLNGKESHFSDSSFEDYEANVQAAAIADVPQNQHTCPFLRLIRLLTVQFQATR